MAEQNTDPGRASPDEELQAARDFVQALVRATRTFRLYPAGHKGRASAAGRVWDTFEQAARKVDGFILTAEPDCFRCKGQVIYRDAGGGGSPAANLYREGVRRLRVQSVAPKEEIIRLVSILATEIAPDSLEDDLVSLLWDADFSCITYELAEAGPTGGYESEATLSAEEEAAPEGSIASSVVGMWDEVDAVQEEAEGTAEERTAAAGIGTSVAAPPPPPPELRQDPRDIDPARIVEIKDGLLTALESAEAQAPPEATDWTSQLSMEEQLADLVREVLADGVDPESLVAAASHGIGLVFSWTREGELGAATDLLADLQQAGQGKSVEPGVKEAIAKEGARLGSPRYIQCLKELLTSGRDVHLPALRELVALLPDEGVAHLVPIAVELRPAYPFHDIFRAIAPSHLPVLYGALSSPDVAVLEFMLDVLEGMADAAVLDHLEPALRCESKKVRLQAVELLRTFAHDPRATELLVLLLDDRSAAIREMAVQDLAASRSPRALAGLWRCILDQEFLKRSRAEKSAVIFALTNNAGDKAVPILRDLLERRQLWGGKRHRDTQELAVQALDAIDSPRAEQALRDCGEKGPRWLRKLCSKMLDAKDAEDEGEESPDL